MFIPKPVNTFVDVCAIRKTRIVASLECFAIGQVVTVGKNPMMQEGLCGGLVLRKASITDYAKEHPAAMLPHNKAILQDAQFYEVSIN